MFIKTIKYLHGKFRFVFLYFPTIVIFIGYVLGILVGEIFNFDLVYPIIIIWMGALLTLMSFFVSKMKVSRFLLLVSAIIIGFGRISYSNFLNKDSLVQSEIVPINEEVHIKALIKEIGYNNGNTNLTIDFIDDYQSYGGFAKLKIVGKLRDYVEDDKISLNVKFEIPENYDEFDYVKYLERKNVFLIGEGYSVEKVGSRFGFTNLIGNLRNIIIQKTRSIVSEPESSLLLGLTIGYRADFDESFETALRKTGTTHIIAVSGYNVTLLVTMIVGIFSVFGRNLSYLLGFLFLILFCFLTGFNIPVLRAALMFFIIWLAKHFGRECNAFHGLSMASLVILIFNPFVLWDISFQLSFLSTVGLIMGGSFDIFNEYNGFWGFLKESLVSTLWAFIITLPVIVFNFSSFTILTFLSNLLVLPLVNITTTLGIVFIIGVITHRFIGLGTSLFLWPALHLIYKIIDWVSHFPFGVINVECKLAHVGVYYIVLFLIFAFSNARKEVAVAVLNNG